MPQKQLEPSEHQIQSACFDWVRLKEKSDPRYSMIYSVPNGGHRHIGVAVKMMKEGQRSGMWDISVDIARGEIHGFKIEVKRPGGKLSEAQKNMGELYRRFGYATRVVYSVDEFIDVVESYFGASNVEER